MTVFVKDGGSFREISELFVRDGTSYTNKTVTNAYVYHSGAWREIYTLFTAQVPHSPMQSATFKIIKYFKFF